MYGRGGHDSVSEEAGADKMYGGAGNEEYMFGGTENDLVKGNGGSEYLYGEQGNDGVYGGDGTDTVDGWYGADHLYGGRGDDTVDTGWRDGARDYVDRGQGIDWYSAGSGPTSPSSYGKHFPRAVAVIEAGIGDALNYLAYPGSHHARIRPTNMRCTIRARP
jgi:hypothetical protein